MALKVTDTLSLYSSLRLMPTAWTWIFALSQNNQAAYTFTQGKNNDDALLSTRCVPDNVLNRSSRVFTASSPLPCTKVCCGSSVQQEPRSYPNPWLVAWMLSQSTCCPSLTELLAGR
jgi:hypothetical protein